MRISSTTLASFFNFMSNRFPTQPCDKSDIVDVSLGQTNVKLCGFKRFERNECQKITVSLKKLLFLTQHLDSPWLHAV